ncbi:YeeE/YedE family protein [Ottowia sp.]|uniref:YeeE/YedE family protein n=1 Tax=Ottowia sp. TaxID=1898956 RepID=UPI002C34E33F|nr:YeeE/YedE family protein [Ottowia sp.]HOB66523.1 YeeE/YedE family protein [Ottowia sp.]HPZ57294.1 YeeE/YedE family protein [Ottowia sp.]HQD48495.1 YeeE/YedE family protein [Ottowia sp.]
MPTTQEIDGLARGVLWGAFALSVLLGAVMHRTRYCTMGAIADVLAAGDATRLRQWVLAAGVAIVGFGVLAWGGWVRPADSLYATAAWAWLSALVGGLLFGVGMVLSSGCGARTLVRMGAGSLKSLVVFLVMGLAAYATLRGITAVARNATVDKAAITFDGPATLGYLVASAGGWPLGASMLGAALLVGVPLVAWALAGRGFITGTNLLAGLGVGGVIVAMWWLSGHVGYVAEHPETLEAAYLATRSGRMEAVTFTGPLAHSIDWLIFFSDRGQRLSLGVASVAGVVVGATLHALATRQFRWEGFRTTEDLANHLVGAVLMGVGGVTALGCTFGQGLSGLSNLSLTSFTAVAAIAAGAVLALKYQSWRLDRSS